MAPNVPKWLDEKFLSYCLNKGKDCEEKRVQSFNVSSAVPNGISYCSLLFRVRTEYKEKDEKNANCSSLIVKGPFENSSADYVQTEPRFYNEFLPAAFEISSSITFAPKTHFSKIPDVIVMEDLCQEGYKLADRRELLDFDHCRLYAIASATFHAVSVAVHKKQPKLVESFGPDKFFTNQKYMAGLKNFFIGGLNYMAEKMRFFDDYKQYADDLRSSSTTIWNMAVDALKPSSPFNTLSQGDAWTGNMMFKYDESDKVCDIKLLDFQGVRYSCLLGDMIFFIYTSANYDVRENRLHDLYRVYCDTINAKLEEYECSERLTFEQLLENITRLSSKALLVAAMSYPLIRNTTDVDTSAIMFGEVDDSVITHAFDQYYDEDYCEKHLPRVLKQLDTAGAFDYVVTRLRTTHT
ncbi:uncharacterized protein LOC124370024 [Homalodisca vitripennis]|uniref:uncharacterized protein LOC124370024 n=1 Tax=Homalodisca vitripennis TaxID=197043 RepID=UPI001EEABAB1|nr:uncharacterized protein LOC124370024 [Homalodisca vitripennis]KAG8301226.1 hypothetical protein J6590_058222 [Homalodisca vitripennis]